MDFIPGFGSCTFRARATGRLLGGTGRGWQLEIKQAPTGMGCPGCSPDGQTAGSVTSGKPVGGRPGSSMLGRWEVSPPQPPPPRSHAFCLHRSCQSTSSLFAGPASSTATEEGLASSLPRWPDSSSKSPLRVLYDMLIGPLEGVSWAPDGPCGAWGFPMGSSQMGRGSGRAAEAGKEQLWG